MRKKRFTYAIHAISEALYPPDGGAPARPKRQPVHHPKSRDITDILKGPEQISQHRDFFEKLTAREQRYMLHARVVHLLREGGLLVPPVDTGPLGVELAQAVLLAQERGVAYVCPGLMRPPSLRRQYVARGWAQHLLFACLKPMLFQIRRLDDDDGGGGGGGGGAGTGCELRVVDIHSNLDDRELTAAMHCKLSLYAYFLPRILPSIPGLRLARPALLWRYTGCCAAECTDAGCALRAGAEEGALDYLRRGEREVEPSEGMAEDALFKRLPRVVGLQRAAVGLQRVEGGKRKTREVETATEV
ncbi:hypothetical protein JCM10450v2_006012 [Rhodotorula kratochvilovae]